MGWSYVTTRGSSTPKEGMALLRTMFPAAQADLDNFVLFSTSGTHGHYGTIEEIEADWGKPDSAFDEPCERSSDVTYLIARPRIMVFQYGNCAPATLEDIAFLKALRASSHVLIAGIGMPHA